MNKYIYQEELASLIQAIAHGERNVEQYRQQLWQIPDFEPFDAFRLIDTQNTGSIHFGELLEYLNAHGVECFPEEISGLLKSTGSNLDIALTYDQFLKLIQPRNMASLRTINMQRRPFERGLGARNLQRIEQAITRFLYIELEYIREIEAIKLGILRKYQISPYESLKLIDFRELGYIDFESLYTYMRKNRFNFTYDDYKSILRRYDLDCDGKLNEEEYKKIIIPINDTYTYVPELNKNPGTHAPNYYEFTRHYDSINPLDYHSQSHLMGPPMPPPIPYLDAPLIPQLHPLVGPPLRGQSLDIPSVAGSQQYLYRNPYLSKNVNPYTHSYATDNPFLRSRIPLEHPRELGDAQRYNNDHDLLSVYRFKDPKLRAIWSQDEHLNQDEKVILTKIDTKKGKKAEDDDFD